MPAQNLINLTPLFSDAVRNVFATMLSMDLETLPLAAAPVDAAGAKVVGTIGLGGTVAGVMHLHLPVGFARLATATMIGLAPDEAGDAEINDVTGELCNMIGGILKSQLCDAGLNCQLSLPSVLRGNDCQIETPGLALGSSVECAFRHDEHFFHALFGLKEGIRNL